VKSDVLASGTDHRQEQAGRDRAGAGSPAVHLPAPDLLALPSSPDPVAYQYAAWASAWAAAILDYGALLYVFAREPSTRCSHGRRFRVQAIVDDFTRECLALVADSSLSGTRVARELLATWRDDSTSLQGLTPNEFARRSQEDHNRNGPSL
jgi:hypothetical protein